MQWPFPEPETCPAFTSYAILAGQDTIAWVYHDASDNTWQFQGQNKDDEPTVAALKTMLTQFPWLADLADLPLGWTATRAGKKWKYEAYVDFEVEDVLELHEQYPDKFTLLPEKQRAGLKKGDLAKLFFTFQDGGEFTHERMWVEVTRASRGNYEGTLRNQPETTDQLEEGSEVEFDASHVLEIEPRK